MLRTFYLRYLNTYCDKVSHQDIELQAFHPPGAEGGKPIPVFPHYRGFTEAKLNRPETFQEPDLHRSILPNEVLIELDEPTVLKNLALGKVILQTLTRKKVPYWAFYSGGKSVHISIFLEAPEVFPEEILAEGDRRPGFSWYGFRDYLAWRLLGGLRKIGKVDRQKLNTRRALIRACGSRHSIKGLCKVYLGNSPKAIPGSMEEFERHYLYTEPSNVDLYPEEIAEWPAVKWVRYLHDYFRYLDKKPHSTLRTDARKGVVLPCVGWLLSNHLPDGRRRAVSLIASQLRGEGDEETLRRLAEWGRMNGLPSTEVWSRAKYSLRYKGRLGCKMGRSIFEDIERAGGPNLCRQCARVAPKEASTSTPLVPLLEVPP